MYMYVHGYYSLFNPRHGEITSYSVHLKRGVVSLSHCFFIVTSVVLYFSASFSPLS